MKSDIVEIIKGFKNYLGEGVIVAALGFAVTPILTRIMSPGDYGDFNVFLSYVSIATIVFTLNVHSSVGRYFYDQKSDFPQFLGSIVLLSTFMFVVSAVVFSHFSAYSWFMLISLLFLTAAAIIESIFRQIYQAKLESRKIALTSITKTGVIFFTILVLAIVYSEGGVEIPLIARMVAGCLVVSYFCISIARHISFGLETEHFKFCLMYAVPLMPYALSNIVLAHFDRIMVMEMADSASAGLYSFAYNIGFIMSLVVGALNSSIYPVFFSNYNAESYAEYDRNIFRTQGGINLVFVFLLLFAEEIGAILGPSEYSEAIHVVPPVVLGYLFYSYFSIYNRNFDYAKKTYVSAAVMMLSVVFNIVANYIFIPRYGYVAAAYTTLGSYFILFLLSWFASNYLLRIHSVAMWGLLNPLFKLIPVLALSLMIKQLDIVWYYATVINIILLIGAVWTVYPNSLALVRRILVKVK